MTFFGGQELTLGPTQLSRRAYVEKGKDNADAWVLLMITRDDQIGCVASRPTEGP